MAKKGLLVNNKLYTLLLIVISHKSQWEILCSVISQPPTAARKYRYRIGDEIWAQADGENELPQM